MYENIYNNIKKGKHNKERTVLHSFYGTQEGSWSGSDSYMLSLEIDINVGVKNFPTGYYPVSVPYLLDNSTYSVNQWGVAECYIF